ncbi:unnamed protein product [Caenorhabditis brenneri]
MSLSRPARLPLLKLPFLCIECVIKEWDIFDIIFFALISKKTRQIVKHLKISLNRIEISVSAWKWIELDGKLWKITGTNCQSLFKEYPSLRKDCLVLQNNEIPVYTRRTNYGLMSYIYGSEFIALKLAMEFLNDVFKCSVEKVAIHEDNFPESGDIGVRSTVNLSIGRHFGYAQSQNLNSLLENLEVTGTCSFRLISTEKSFYCDPKLFKCKKLKFRWGSAAWITREILLQFEVPQLMFFDCSFSVQDILSFVTYWFHSDNKKLEYLYIDFQKQISLDDFQASELNPSSFNGRNRVPSPKFLDHIDFSEGLEIVRHDGLQATIHVSRETFLFYIWHDQSAITQN